MTLKRSVRMLIALLLTVTMIQISPAIAMADEVPEDNANGASVPLDLSDAAASSSGDGWEWNDDTKTLTLTGLNMDLTEYAEAYDAAIKLPDADSKIIINGSNTIKVKGGAVQDPELGSRDAVYTPGNLQISGDGVLDITAADGANGIEAGKNLIIAGESDDNGPAVEAYATEFAINADETIDIIHATVEAGITGKNGLSAILANNNNEDENGLIVNSSDLTLSAGGRNAAGLMTGDGDLLIMDSSVSQTPVKGAKDTDGIVVVGGSVDIMDKSQIYLDLGYGRNQGDCCISAAFGGPEYKADKNIYIKDSTVRGMNADVGLDAEYGGVVIDNSKIDFKTTGYSIDCSFNGLDINKSNVTLRSIGDFYEGAARADGKVKINDSIFNAFASGPYSGGLIVNSDSDTIFSGKNTKIHLKGKLAGIELHTSKAKKTKPLKLNNGLYTAKGGKLQSVKDDGDLTWSFSASKLAMKHGDLANASKEVLINALKRNTLSVKGKTVKIRYKVIKKKARTITKARAYTVKNAKGTVSYKLKGVVKAKFKKYFKVNAKTGKITVKKGLKKGTYKVRVNVTAKGNKTYNPATKTATVTVRVK